MYPYCENYCDFQRLLLIWGGGGFKVSGKGFTGGFTKRGVHGGVHRGFTKRGVHVNPVNPPDYGPDVGPIIMLSDLYN